MDEMDEMKVVKLTDHEWVQVTNGLFDSLFKHYDTNLKNNAKSVEELINKIREQTGKDKV